jgi:hypothetical protein
MMAKTATTIAVLCFVLVLGCNKRSTDEILNDARLDPVVISLDRVGRIYMGYHDAYGKGPSDWEELVYFVEDDEGGLEAIRLVRDNGFKLKWRVIYSEVGKKRAAEFILGESRWNDAKLMLDGKIRYEE